MGLRTPWAALVGCRLCDRLCTPRHHHQFVRSRHKFLRFSPRSDNRRFWMFERRSHRCEFCEFCIVHRASADRIRVLMKKTKSLDRVGGKHRRPQISQDIRTLNIWQPIERSFLRMYQSCKNNSWNLLSIFLANQSKPSFGPWRGIFIR
jgi:hypothetical protein